MERKPVNWTIGELLQWTTAFFTRSGIDEARLSAELLLTHALSCSRMALYTRFDQIPPPDQIAAFREMVKQRKEHVPVAYLIGKAWFYSLEFAVTPDVLIPRPDTETMVEQVIRLARLTTSWETPEILDLCTGSGCIAIALAKNLPTARITASDISRAALQVAEKNAATHEVAARIHFISGDLLEPAAALSPPIQFHIIVCNPPYIVTDKIAELMPEVAQHEPRLALDGGADGLEFYRRIAAQAGELLAPDGVLIVESAFDQTVEVEKLLVASGIFHASRIMRDVAGHPRCVLVRKADCG
ncbi:MAG: peptide chain release factor N(5)-glutamine methyltransferase [Phycisphaerae bacterium]